MRRRDLIAAAVATGIAPVARAAQHPVVVELFTSQGCSSCPPADPLLGPLARRPTVIALAWHVDSWEQLGWRHGFASGSDRPPTRPCPARQRRVHPALVVEVRVVIGSARLDQQRSSRQALPVALTLNRSGTPSRWSRRRPGSGARSRITTTGHATDVAAGGSDGERLREYHRARDRDAGRLGRSRTTVHRQASRSRPGSGHPATVARPAHPRCGRPARGLIRAIPPSSR